MFEPTAVADPHRRKNSWEGEEEALLYLLVLVSFAGLGLYWLTG